MLHCTTCTPATMRKAMWTAALPSPLPPLPLLQILLLQPPSRPPSATAIPAGSAAVPKIRVMPRFDELVGSWCANVQLAAGTLHFTHPLGHRLFWERRLLMVGAWRKHSCRACSKCDALTFAWNKSQHDREECFKHRQRLACWSRMSSCRSPCTLYCHEPRN